MSSDELKVQCPTCAKTVVRGSQAPAPFFPFCSKRCKLVDLGRWFDEEHRIEEPEETGRGGASVPDEEI